jgi:hypothetical protein
VAVVHDPEARVRNRRPVLFAALGWVLCNVLVLAVAKGTLPFDWPDAASRTPVGQLVNADLGLLEVLLLAALVVWMTRKRPAVNLADRAPERSIAARETLLLPLYGACGLLMGFVLARLLGWHPFGLHLAGSLYGTHAHVSPTEAIAWAVYNLVVYAVIPLLYFGRRYSSTALSLKAGNRRADAVLIGVVLAIEALVQIAALDPGIFELNGRQLAIGVPLTLVLYFAGAVLPMSGTRGPSSTHPETPHFPRLSCC